jgi:hypothetical protein
VTLCNNDEAAIGNLNTRLNRRNHLLSTGRNKICKKRSGSSKT